MWDHSYGWRVGVRFLHSVILSKVVIELFSQILCRPRDECAANADRTVCTVLSRL